PGRVTTMDHLWPSALAPAQNERVQAAPAVISNVYVPAGMKLEPLDELSPLSNSTNRASSGLEDTANWLMPSLSGCEVQVAGTPCGSVSGASVLSPLPVNFWPIGDGGPIVMVFGGTERAHTFVPCTFVQWPGLMKTVRSA